MKTLKHFNVALLFLTILFSGCDDSEKPKGEFATAVFVVNEGNFLDADGTISSINPSTGVVAHDLFGSVNDGRALGDVVQSMTIDRDVAYIVVNNSNKMEVVNANTFESLYTIENLSLPRYFITHNGKGYVSEWVNFSDPGRISVIDIETHTVTGTIVTDYGAENLIAVNGKIYVSNSFTNTVSVIDPATAQLINSIQVGHTPGSLLMDDENKLWVICGGGYDLDYNPQNDGKLVQIDPATNALIKTIELNSNVAAKAAMDKSKTNILYYAGSSVYKVNVSATQKPTAPFITEVASTGFYGIGIDPKTDVIYLSDANGFATNGKAFRYTSTGVPIDIIATDRGPNSFVFNY